MRGDCCVSDQKATVTGAEAIDGDSTTAVVITSAFDLSGGEKSAVTRDRCGLVMSPVAAFNSGLLNLWLGDSAKYQYEQKLLNKLKQNIHLNVGAPQCPATDTDT